MADLRPVPAKAACDHTPDSSGRCTRCGRFVRGNLTARTHGADSAVGLAIEVDRARDEIEAAVGDGPGCEDRFALSREQASALLARVRRMRRYVERNDIVDRKGRLRP